MLALLKRYAFILFGLAFVFVAVSYKSWSSIAYKQPAISVSDQPYKLNVTVLATNDLHSNFDGLGLQSYPEFKTGHYARLANILNQIRQDKLLEHELVLTLDAGDWYSGSLFDNLASSTDSTSIPQLEFFHYAKFDAIILGNHEFDDGEDALYIMLNKAKNLDLNINILGSNMVLSTESRFNEFRGDSTVKILPYITRETMFGKVGVLGYTGPDAALASSVGRDEIQYIGFTETGGIDYASLWKLVKQQVLHLRTVEKCVMVITLLHGGLKDSEDLKLANIEGVDLVIAGHTHEQYLFQTAGNSFISQCGSMGEYITFLNVGIDHTSKFHIREQSYNYKNAVDALTPQCVRIDASVEMDKIFNNMISGWIEEINHIYKIDYSKIVFEGDLSEMRWQDEEPGAVHAFIVSTLLLKEADLYSHEKGEDRLAAPFGWFWTDDFIRMEKFTAPDPTNVKMTYSDVYNMLYVTARKPLSVFYIQKSAVQIILSGVEIVHNFVSSLIKLTIGGITYDLNYYGIPFYNRFTNLKTVDGLEYQEWPEYIKIVTNGFAAPFLWKVKALSRGIIRENLAKNEFGESITFKQSLLVDGPTEFDLLLRLLTRKS